MGSGDELQIVDVVELSGHLGAEKPSSATGRDRPGVDVLGVGPHQVGEGTLVRNFHAPVDKTDLIKGLDFGRKTTMDTEDLAFNDGSNTKVIEDFGAVLPGVDVTILAHSLFVEAVDGGDTTGLVVTSEEGDAVGPLELEAEKELEGLNGVIAAIDEITHEDVAGVGDLTALFEKLEEVMELTVDITADGDRGTDGLHIAFLDQDLLDFLAKDAEVSFRQDATVLDSSEP